MPSLKEYSEWADEYVADLACEFGYPIVIVSPNVLGTINQTLQTLITANCFRSGMDVAGIVLNDAQSFQDDFSQESNRDEIAKRAQPPLLAHVRYESTQFEPGIDWYALATAKK